MIWVILNILFIYFLFSVKKITRKLAYRELKKELMSGYPLFNKLLYESKKIIDARYDSPKFIFLDYPQLGENKPLLEDEIDKIKLMGIIYINVEDLIGHELRGNTNYFVSDKIHPNAKAWEEITPKLADNLSLL